MGNVDNPLEAAKAGIAMINPEPHEDERGFLAETAKRSDVLKDFVLESAEFFDVPPGEAVELDPGVVMTLDAEGAFEIGSHVVFCHRAGLRTIKLVHKARFTAGERSYIVHLKGRSGTGPATAPPIDSDSVTSQVPAEKLMADAVKGKILRNKTVYHTKWCKPGELIDGVKIYDLPARMDGSVRRIVLGTGADAYSGFDLHQANYSQTQQGVIKAFHYHERQEDIWFFPSGRAKVVLVDLRKASPTFGLANTIVCSEHSPRTIVIPRGVAHGYECLTDVGILYLVNEEYNLGKPDELRQRWDSLHYGGWGIENR